jgi:hypothetical protein
MSGIDSLIDRLHDWRDTRQSGQRHVMISLDEVDAILAAKQAQLDAVLGIAPVKVVELPKPRKRIVKNVVKNSARKPAKKAAKRVAKKTVKKPAKKVRQ